MLIRIIDTNDKMDQNRYRGLHIEIWLGNNRDNFQLHRVITSENMALFFGGGATFLTCTVFVLLISTVVVPTAKVRISNIHLMGGHCAV